MGLVLTVAIHQVSLVFALPAQQESFLFTFPYIGGVSSLMFPHTEFDPYCFLILGLIFTVPIYRVNKVFTAPMHRVSLALTVPVYQVSFTVPKLFFYNFHLYWSHISGDFISPIHRVSLVFTISKRRVS